MLGSIRDGYTYARDKADGSRDMRAKVQLGVWTPKFAGEELVEAVRWAEKMAEAAGAASRETFFRDIDLSGGERSIEAWPAIQQLRISPSRTRAASPTRVSQFERILGWPAKYLPHGSREVLVLNGWTRSIVRDAANFGEACELMGWSRATAYRTRDRALAAIAAGLTADRIARGEH